MKNAKRILSILIACAMLMMVMPMAVAAEGTQDNPINAHDKWFGYGVDCYLLNPTIAEGTADGVWYTLTVEQEGILYLEHKYKDVDYTITLTTDNGLVYEGGSVDGVIYNGPIMTLPVQVGDVATIQIVTKDAAAGTVYANMNIVAGDSDNPIKVKSNGIMVYVGAGETVYFQDDTLNADYATKGLLVEGSVDDTVFYAVTINSTSGAVTAKAFTDSDGDGIIEAKLGGSLGSAGAPPVKPAWAIENNSTDGIGTLYTLTIVDDAHECVYDDDADTDCNTCGAVRELAHKHEYDHDFDTVCNTCGEEREVNIKTWFNMAGASKSADVDGFAFKYNVKVAGMKVKGTTAIYDNATIEGFKLIGMGAVISNSSTIAHPTLEDVDGIHVVDVPAVYLCNVYNEYEDTVSFAIRVKEIPDEHKDALIQFYGYFIVEIDGVQTILYDNGTAGAYNQF